MYCAGGSRVADGANNTTLVACTDGPIRAKPKPADYAVRERLERKALECAMGHIARLDHQVVISDFYPGARVLDIKREWGISKPIITTLHGEISNQERQRYARLPF